MKYNYLMIAALVVITSCSKKDTQNDAAVLESNNQIELLKRTADFQAGVQVYNLMPAEARYKLWNDHLFMAKNQFTSSGQNGKAVLIDQLLNNIQRDVFAKNTKDADVFSNYFMPGWYQKAKLIFTNKELYDLLFDPAAESIGTLVAPPDIGDNLADCFCHVGTSGFSCRKTTVSFPGGVTIEEGICEQSGDCNSSNLGCGWLWLYSCNGNHCNF